MQLMRHSNYFKTNTETYNINKILALAKYIIINYLQLKNNSLQMQNFKPYIYTSSSIYQLTISINSGLYLFSCWKYNPDYFSIS